MDVINDYVVNSLNEKEEEIPKKTKNKKQKKEENENDEELNRKKDILCTIILTDNIEFYLGEKYSVAEIRKMKKEKLESIFKLYQIKYGQDILNQNMEIIISLIVKSLSFFLTFDDNELLKKDLMENKTLKNIISEKISSSIEKYGDIVGIFKISWDITKHIKFKKEEEEVVNKCEQNANKC